MALPLLTGGVCGLSLRKSTLIISWVTLVLSVIVAVSAVVNACIYYNALTKLQADEFPRDVFYDSGSFDRQYQDLLIRQSKERILMDMATFTFSLGVLALVMLFTRGTYKKNPRQMYPGILIAAIVLCFSVITTFKETWDMGINRYVFHEICFCAMGYYCFLVIWNYYMEVKRSAEEGNVLTQQVLTPEAFLSNGAPLKEKPTSPTLHV